MMEIISVVQVFLSRLSSYMCIDCLTLMLCNNKNIISIMVITMMAVQIIIINSYCGALFQGP